MNACILIGLKDEELTEEQSTQLPVPEFYDDDGNKYWGNAFSLVGDDYPPCHETIDPHELVLLTKETERKFKQFGITVPRVYPIIGDF